jgi:ubiquinone biosynthesis protein UbiJ
VDPRFFIVFAMLGTGAVLLRPLVAAIADRIRHSRTELPPAESAELVDEVRAMRQELAELAERVDFTERLLAKNADPARIGSREAER